MPKSYWIPHLDVHNPDGYKAYMAATPPAHHKYAGVALVRGGTCEVMEGRARSRNVLREFPDYATALACYRSSEYQSARPLRLPHSSCDFVIAEGYDGQQWPPVGTPPAAAAREGYRIAHVDVTDPEGYKAYIAANALPFGKFGARFLVRGGNREVVEGKVRGRTVVLEFPSFEAALDCYRSSDYQAALRCAKARLTSTSSSSKATTVRRLNERQHLHGTPTLTRLGWWSVVAVFCGAVLLPAAVDAVGLFLSAPARAIIGAPPADLHAEQVTIASPSGATLRGWFIAGQPGGGAVVLMHGVQSNRLSMLPRARLLNAAGFSVLLFDFQAHGESTGNRITFGHREGLDAHAAVAFVRQRLPAERIGVIGSSLGGAAALLGPGPLPVDALVLESVYSEIGTAVANRIHATLPIIGGLVARPLAWLFELLLPPIIGVGPADLRPIDRIADVTVPVLVAVGTRDDRTTIAEATAMFERAHEPKSLWSVEGARHVDLEAYAPGEYHHRVLPFLAERLQKER